MKGDRDQSSSEELCNSDSSSEKQKVEREGKSTRAEGATGGLSRVGKVEQSGSLGKRVESISCLAQEVAEATIALIAAAVAASGALAASVAASDELAAAVAASVMAVCRA